METLINNYSAKERAIYRLNEQFVSNITGDIFFFSARFWPGLRNALDNKHLTNDLPTPAKTENFSLKKNITKCEQRAMETLINNYLAN